MSLHRDLVLIGALTAFILFGWIGFARAIAAQLNWLPPLNPDVVTLLGREPQFAKPAPATFLSGVFQTRLEASLRDGVPLLNYILPLNSHLKAFAGAAWLSPFPETWAPLTPTGTSEVIATRDRQRLIRKLILDKENSAALQQQADFFNRLAVTHPQLGIHLFAVRWPEETFATFSVWPKPTRRILAGNEYMKEFQARLAPTVGFSWAGRDKMPEEAIAYHFKTDHHLHIRGAYNVYLELIAFLQARGLNMRSPVEWVPPNPIEDVEFYGSYARWGGGYTLLSDSLYDSNFSLPDFSVAVERRGPDNERNQREDYIAGKIPPGKFADHYRNYFGDNAGLVHYKHPKPSSERKLLVLSDSLDNILEPLIATHFSETFFIDERYYYASVDERLVFSDFVAEHGISDVLFFQTGRVLCGWQEAHR